MNTDLFDDAADEITALRAEVERLRSGGCARDQGTTQYCAEAAILAAKVGKLEAECFSLAAWQCKFPDGKTGLVAAEGGDTYCAMAKEVERLRAENERLEDENKAILAANRDVMLHWDVLKADYERLRIENIQMRFALGYPMPADLEHHILPSNPFKCGTCDAANNVRAEVERLRAALEPFACMCSVKGEGVGGLCFKGSCLYWNARAALEGK